MRNYSIDYFPYECGCKSKKCHSNITGWKDLTIQQKKDYEHFAAPYLRELDAKHALRAEPINILASSTRGTTGPNYVNSDLKLS